jgi:hypothetical protein
MPESLRPCPWRSCRRRLISNREPSRRPRTFPAPNALRAVSYSLFAWLQIAGNRAWAHDAHSRLPRSIREPCPSATRYSRRMLCACGCGRLTAIASKTDAKRGAVRGKPTRFVVGHYQRQPLAGRFWARVCVTDGCWEWTGRIDGKGYGRMKIRRVPYYAHRLAWELAYGSMPPHVLVRHLCGNHRCVRVDHLAARRSSLHERRTHALEQAHTPEVRSGPPA